MKWIKKILRIIAIILPAFCLFVGPGVSAKKYSIDSFSQHSYSIYAPNSSSSDGLVPLNLRPEIWLNNMSGVSPRKVAYLNSSYDGNSCYYTSGAFSNSVYNSGTSFSYGSSFIPNKTAFVSYIGNVSAKCRTFDYYGSSIGSFTVPNFNHSTVPFNQSINIASLVAKDTDHLYNFMYNNLYFNSTRESDGKVYNGKFFVSDLLNIGSHSIDTWERDENYKYFANRITRFSFPLNVDSSKEYLDPTKNIVISGYINIPLLTSVNMNVFIDSRFIDTSNYSVSSSTTACTVVDYQATQAFTCNITVPFSTNFYGFNLVVSGGQYDDFSTVIFNSSFIDADDDEAYFSFSNFSITINGDSSSGGSIGFDTIGSYPNVSPGTPSNPSSVDWTSSLANLFTFNFLNPFAAIYNMFTDNASCTQIPILADMLGSNETEYCPWFSTDTRNILTPVIGLSSMMLLFGFVMSWLKSSSGNMIEDSSHETISSINGSGFRRYKK